MMMDAHTMFSENWDTKFMNNWNDLQDELAIITSYPHGFILREDGRHR